jgi:hypothetical protein
MSFFVKKKDKHIVVVLNSSSLSCVEIIDVAGRFVVKSYKQHVFDSYEIASGTIVNSDNLFTIFKRFLPKEYIAQQKITCILGPSLLDDRFALHATVDILSASKFLYKAHYVLSIEYLYPEDEFFVFYISYVSQILLLQLQLLFARCLIDCSIIMSYFFPLLQCYKSLHGSAYRRTQLTCDMQKNNNNLLSFFSPDIVHRLIDVSSIHVSLDWPTILSACGSFLLNKDS